MNHALVHSTRQFGYQNISACIRTICLMSVHVRKHDPTDPTRIDQRLGPIFEGHIDNRKKILLNSNTSFTCLHDTANFGPLTAEIGSGVWDTPAKLKFQRVSRLGSVTARHSSSGRQPSFAALNSGRHLYSAGRPSRWALAQILVMAALCNRGAIKSYIFAL